VEREAISKIDILKNSLRGASAQALISNGIVDLLSQEFPKDTTEEAKIKDALAMFSSEKGWWNDREESLELISFFAKSADKYIGVLSITDFNNNAKDHWSTQVWNFLRERTGNFAEKAALTSGHFLLASGVVVDESWRRSGVYSKLTNYMLNDLNPAVVMGTSSSPIAVEARAVVMKNRGYRTFYGKEEITPDFTGCGKPEALDPIRMLSIPGVLYRLDEVEKDLKEASDPMCIKELDVNEFPPDISSVSPRIKAVFQKVIEKQTQANIVGEPLYVFNSLISIRKDLL
jgi:hypothetical protein